MNRTDSGYHESRVLKTSYNGITSLQRSNTAPTRRRKTRKTIAESISSNDPIEMELQQPASEKRSRPLQQRSTTASSENSTTRSRGRGHGSKPSSRRTSCTIVDPSRPVRHYRMKSSQTLPTAMSRDIDDVLALHFRSHSLFQNPSIHTYSGLPSPSLSPADNFGFPSPASRFSTDDVDVSEECSMPKHSEEIIANPEKMNTTMHWTSPSTRQRDYNRIDKANSGFRGFLNKVVPRCVSGPQEKFYEKDQSDAGSVRRYRLEDVDDVLNEKDGLQLQSCPMQSSQATKKKWICF